FAFISGDVVQRGGFNSVSREVGSINGKDISYDDFNLKVANVEKSGQGLSLTQAANRVWEQEVNVALLQEQFEKLGIRVGERHILEVFKNNPQIGQNPTFQTAGVFDINKFKEFFRSNPQQEVFLKEAEKDAAINAQFEIYSSMIRGAAFATDVEGKLKYQMENDKVTFNYVAVPFSSVKDSDVKVTDEEIVAYMRENEKKYKAEESREIEYVLIEDKPSKADEDEVKKNIDALMEGKVVYNEKTGTNDTVPGFRNTANIIDFVNENSDFPYDSTYIAKSDLPAEVQGMFDLPVGGIYGPYMRGGFYAVSKVMGRKAGAKAKASHILISYEGTAVPNKKEKRTKEEAKAKAESLLSQAKANPSGFMMLALVNSDDSSAQQGGDLGYFGPNQMVKPFNDFVFNNPVGTIGLVETDFGFHVINVTEKQD
ncbi:MAG TPA: peptidylprolyl isomerase, partial [Flavobacterium sp.]|nr:peptidylprolyl isomerase [Flavobacterium sp.]